MACEPGSPAWNLFGIILVPLKAAPTGAGSTRWVAQGTSPQFVYLVHLEAPAHGPARSAKRAAASPFHIFVIGLWGGRKLLIWRHPHPPETVASVWGLGGCVGGPAERKRWSAQRMSCQEGLPAPASTSICAVPLEFFFPCISPAPWHTSLPFRSFRQDHSLHRFKHSQLLMAEMSQRAAQRGVGAEGGRWCSACC